jgi:hypothetical protein
MSRLLQTNGDDHPEAAKGHLAECSALLNAELWDASAYHAGYVVECSMKSLLLASKPNIPRVHDFEELSHALALIAPTVGPTLARYFSVPEISGLSTAGVSTWNSSMRYHARGKVGAVQASSWWTEASAFYQATVARMQLDGVV